MFLDELCLLIEQFMQRVKMRAGDVPVVVFGLGVQQVLVGQQAVQR